jgi:hypothetical protein
MTSQWHGGKGSSSRPFSVTQDEYDNRWDLIFGKDKTKIEAHEQEHDEDDLDEDNQDEHESETDTEQE